MLHDVVIVLGLFAWLGKPIDAVFLAAALLAIPALALAFRSVAFPVAPELRHDQPRALPRIYWLYWAALLLFVAIEFSIVFWSTDYLESVRELPRARAVAAASAFLIGITLGRVAGGWLSRRVAAPRLLGGALVVAACGFAAFWLVPDARIAVPGLAVSGTGVALLYPLTLALAIRAADGRTDAASARAAFATGSAIACAPFALGAAADAFGLRAAFGLVAVLIAGGSVIFAAAVRGERRARRDGSPYY